MKKNDQQLNFMKELEQADELEESLEPKEAQVSSTDLGLSSQEVASEIEHYLNEEPDSNLNPESSDFKAQESTPIISKKKAYWGKVHGESREEQAKYDRLAQENIAKIKAGLDAKDKTKKTPVSDKPVSLINSGADNFSLDSDDNL